MPRSLQTTHYDWHDGGGLRWRLVEVTTYPGNQ